MLWTLPLLPAAAGVALWAANPASRLALGGWAAAALAATFALAVAATLSGWTGALAWSHALRLGAALTPASAVVAALVPFVALAVAIYAAAHEAREGLARLLGLMLVFTGGMELLVVADDFLTLLIGWEIVGLCSWALIGHRWREREGPEAGLYAFVATRLGDVGLFLAAFAVFAGSGGFAFGALPALPSPWIEVAAFGVLVSAAAKSGQIPFSPWLFRAMAGPTSVSALLHAATMVAAGAYLLARLGPALLGAEGFAPAAVLLGLATALGGGIVALCQNHAKKLLAASTSAQYGLMIVAVGAGWPGVALLHLVAHAGFKALLFLAAGVAHERTGSFALDRMGLGRALPWTAALALIGALALAAVPPLGAAWTKEEIVASALHASPWAGAGVMIAGALSAAYAARFQRLAFGLADETPEGEGPRAAELGGLALLAAASLALSALWWPSLHEATADRIAAELPPSGAAERAVSLLLVALGLLVGLFLARGRPSLGREDGAAAAAEWFGLPKLIRLAAIAPVARLSAAAARFDDRTLDALPRAAARGARALSRGASRGDRHAVDGGVALVAALAAWAARAGERVGERLAEGLPSGSGWLLGESGRELRRLQSGLSHHYYALLAIGAAGMILLLLLGP